MAWPIGSVNEGGRLGVFGGAACKTPSTSFDRIQRVRSACLLDCYTDLCVLVLTLLQVVQALVSSA